MTSPAPAAPTAPTLVPGATVPAFGAQAPVAGNRNCTNCPSFIMAEDVPRRYRRGPGSAMCGFHDKPIGTAVLPDIRDKSSYLAIGAKLAEKCAGFGKAPVPAPRRTYPVAFTRDVPPTEDPMVKSCQSCQHYAPADVVSVELGWKHGLCTTKGTLIPPQNATYAARDCTWRLAGNNAKTLIGTNLFPEYEEDFLTPDLVGNFLNNNAEVHSEETDKPVTDEDKAGGIRAWRRIADQDRPSMVSNIFLPIYDASKLTDAQRSKVPQTGDDEHPELYIDHNNAVYKVAVLWTELDETPALWGMAGVGKTELYRHMAWIMQLPFERISITGSTELDDLAGKTHYEEGRGTYFEFGRLPRAWSEPVVICLDEPNVGQPDVWQFIRPLTDNSKQLVLDMAEGQVIERHADCYFGMAMNPAWDPRNVGAATIGDADGSRLMHISMELPPEDIEKQIITARCKLDGWEIPKTYLKAVMGIAKEVRALSADDSLPITWGIRPQIKVARALRHFAFMSAYRMAAADFLEPEQAQRLLDVVRSHKVDEDGGAAPKAQREAKPGYRIN